jgi:hypothetical protein
VDEDAREEMRLLGRRWAREVASADELAAALRRAEGGHEPLPPSAEAFMAANGPAARGPELVALFLDGIATSEGEE